MEKYRSEKHSQISNNLPFSYFSTNLYLDWCGYIFERNKETLVVWQDILYPNEFPSIFMPLEKENWIRSAIALATEKDIQNLKNENIEILIEKPMGFEFFYKTDDFINPTGSLKNRINKFINSYKYSTSNKADNDKITEFYNSWKKQKEHESITFEESEDFFFFCMNNLDKYDIEQVYVEIDGKIAGLAWGIALSDNWVGLHLKVDYKYSGLSRYLHHERAKLFNQYKEFSLGTGAQDKGIDQFKEDLGPAYKNKYSYVLSGEKAPNAD